MKEESEKYTLITEKRNIMKQTRWALSITLIM